MPALTDPPRVFTLEPDTPFLPALAATVRSQLAGREPLALADAVVLVPTRRAARGLALAFLDAAPGTATVLPRIRTLGDLDPEGDGLADLEPEAPEALPPLPPLARRLTLARLVRSRDVATGWSGDPVSALAAGDALARLMDRAGLEAAPGRTVAWEQLAQLVPGAGLAAHWQTSADFLSIVAQAWPQVLAAEGCSDPAGRTARALLALARRWQDSPPDHPVIIAGSTGSVPAVRELMATVTGLPAGAVLLPGLDRTLAAEAWAEAARDPQHPQYALAGTLSRLGLTPPEVADWPQARAMAAAGPDRALRRRVLAEALTPKDATAGWLDRVRLLEAEAGAGALARGLDGLSVIEAATEEEEADAIALALREVLERPDATAALVTPDRTIARRVAAKLRRWDVEVDLSDGTPLSDTPAGAFVRLALGWALDSADPAALLALLAHPLTGLGLDPEVLAAGRDGLERVLLRQARKDATVQDLAARLERTGPGAFGHRRADRAAARAVVAALADLPLPVGADLTLADLARDLCPLVEALAATPAQTGADRLWRGPAGEALARLTIGLQSEGARLDLLRPRDAVRCLERLMAGETVRPLLAHPRLSVLGPLEARLLAVDRVILAGLDEGIWPAPPAPDPFLSPAMQTALGLPPPEAATGQAAHDFAQLASAPEVILTRSARRGEAPAVPSRWLWRLRTLASAPGQEAARGRLDAVHPLLALARTLVPERRFEPAAARPAPRPPVAARPDSFSATQIETWIRDPYTLYVKKVLDLEPLDPVGGDPGAAERGSAIHAALEIVGDWAGAVPDDAAAQLRARLRTELAAAGFAGPALAAEVRRMEPGIGFVVGLERARRAQGWVPLVERWVRATLPTAAGPVHLKAKADRIDVHPDGGLEVLDFKTGAPKSARQVATLMAPQLPVTAAIIAAAPQQPPVPQRVASNFAHIRVGNRKPELRAGLEPDGPGAGEIVAAAREAVVRLYERYADPDMPYLSKPRVQFVTRVTHDEPVDRLARRGEWADAAGETGEEG